MRNVIVVVTMLTLILSGAPGPARAQSGWCSGEYPERNMDTWQVLNGSAFQYWSPPGLYGFRSVAGSGVGVDYQVAKLLRNYGQNPIIELTFSVYIGSLTEIQPYIYIELRKNFGTVGNAFRVLPSFQAQNWQTFNVAFSSILSDQIEITIQQNSASGDAPSAFYVRIDQICWGYPYSQFTSTPTPVTVTNTPTFTPQATQRYTNTPISTWTRTPTNTRTPGTATPTKTGTVGPGTITPTPTDPYDWTPPPGLNSGPFPTPTPRTPQLRWVLPVPVFMTPDLSVPTLIPQRSTSTPPLAGTAVGAVSGSNVIGVDLSDSLTRVADYRSDIFAWQTQVFLDADGTPMADLRNQANLIANNIGGFFYVLRSVRDATGQIGDLVVVLLGLIAFNIIIRLSVFGIGLILFLWRALRSLIDLVSKTPALLLLLVIIVIVIVLIIVLGGASAGDWASPTLTLETPVATSTGTITATHTLLPISPTPTPQFRGFRMTPTPIPINTTPIFDVSVGMPDISGQTADQVINGYKTLNTGTRGAIDLLAFMALAGITIGMAVRLINRLNKDK